MLGYRAAQSVALAAAQMCHEGRTLGVLADERRLAHLRPESLELLTLAYQQLRPVADGEAPEWLQAGHGAGMWHQVTRQDLVAGRGAERRHGLRHLAM